MRASQYPEGPGQTGQWWYLWDHLWGRSNLLCRYYCDCDRRRRIAAHLRAEDVAVPLPTIEANQDQIVVA